MTIQPHAVHIIDQSEYHMISDRIAVVWGVQFIKENLSEVRDGITWTAQTEKTVRKSEAPWIELVWIRCDRDDVYYIEDSPEVSFTVPQAQAVAEALRQAVQYIQEQTNA